MKEWFADFNFRTSSMEMIRQANGIIAEYQKEGLTLTLRQLYYQFVSRDLLPNNQKSYDNLGRTISNARIAGLIDWDSIEDRTRFLRGLTHWENPANMIETRARQYAIDMWANQEIRPEVWIEKDALVGVIESVCQRNDVDYFACRGYVSQSELYAAGKRIEARRLETGQATVVIHLGDHDPSGLDMTRDNLERLEMFSGGGVEVRRIALNYDQVQKYNPPPNPAKMTDSRVGEYIAKHGYESWELDALEPRVLQRLIQRTIDEYKDADAWNERFEQLEKDKATLKEIVDNLKK